MPSSVYATYLVSGKQYIPDESTAINQIHGDGEDAVMQSSPFMSSPVPLQDRGEDQAFINVITLAGEGDLEGMNLSLSLPRKMPLYEKRT